MTAYTTNKSLLSLEEVNKLVIEACSRAKSSPYVSIVQQCDVNRLVEVLYNTDLQCYSIHIRIHPENTSVIIKTPTFAYHTVEKVLEYIKEYYNLEATINY